MIRRLGRIFLVFAGIVWGINFGSTGAYAQVAVTKVWTSLAEGITYREFYLEHPNHIYVARMERNSEHVSLDTGLGNGNLNSGLQTVRGMAPSYDQSLSYWGREWGPLNRVVVAINGFFYDVDTGVPWSGQVISGWYAKHFDERESTTGLVWTFNREIFVGQCIVHPPSRQIINFLSVEGQLFFDSINTQTGDNSLVIYTPQFGPSTLDAAERVEVLVRLDRPFIISPSPAMVEGEIVDIYSGQNKTFIPFDHIVLSASGEQRENIVKLARVGDRIGISQELKHYLSDCKTPNPVNWENIYAASGSSFVFLKEGQVQSTQDDLGAILRTPRTAIAYNDRYVFFIVVDGRDRYRSLGMSMVELALFAKMTLGADWGVAMDGGGSSTMVINGEVVNHPLTEIEDVEAFLPKVEKSRQSYLGEGTLVSLPSGGNGNVIFQNSMQAQEIERAVANGWFMVNILPGEFSTRFKEGESILVIDQDGLDLRLGPGDNYPAFSTVPYQSKGLLVAHELNGVFARGTHWWLVRFGEIQAWVSEQGISGQ